MKPSSAPSDRLLSRWALSVIALVIVGCSLTSFDPPLTSTVDGFSLSALKEIQDDSRLTQDEKRAQIRTLSGAPDTPEGDLLVDFYLNLNIP